MTDHVTPGSAGAVEMVVLDFDGVCTPSHRELADVDHVPAVPPIRPGCADLVRRLVAERLVVAVLSDEIPMEWRDTIPLLGLVDHVLCGSDNRIFKPDRRAFQRCAMVAGVDPGAVLVVDDSPTNIAVAASLGMLVERFDTTNVDGSWERVRSRLGW